MKVIAKYILLILVLTSICILTFDEIPLKDKYTPYTRENLPIMMLMELITSIEGAFRDKYGILLTTPVGEFKPYMCIEWANFENILAFMGHSKEALVKVSRFSKDISNVITYTYEWYNVRFKEGLWMSGSELVRFRGQEHNLLVFTGIGGNLLNMRNVYTALMLPKEQYVAFTSNLKIETTLGRSISVFSENTILLNIKSGSKLRTLLVPSRSSILKLSKVDEYTAIVFGEAYTSTKSNTSEIIDRSIIYGLIAILCLIIAIEAFIIYSYSKKIERLRRRVRFSILTYSAALVNACMLLQQY